MRFRCTGSYYGAQCEIDGEVLGVAVGSSLVAILIIITTLACLCAWRYYSYIFILLRESRSNARRVLKSRFRSLISAVDGIKNKKSDLRYSVICQAAVVL